jgi:hypothetical protein
LKENVMSNRPTRQRPSGQSPIVLSPQVERLHTPADEAISSATVPVETPLPVTVTPVDSTAPEKESAASTAPPVRYEIDPSATKPVTLAIQTRLKKRMETAIFATGGTAEGHTSQARFVNAAIERELERLEQLYNNGVEFPANDGAFRTGRPLGN